MLIVTEGLLEVHVARKMLGALGMADSDDRVISKGGLTRFWRDAKKYNQAARHQDVFGLADLEGEPCPSGLIAKHVGRRHPRFVLRIAERALESWFLADHIALAEFLHVKKSAIPENPDSLRWPKKEIVRIAQRSKRAEIRAQLTRGPDGGESPGPEYTTCMEDFVLEVWSPDRAKERSESLLRALVALQVFVA